MLTDIFAAALLAAPTPAPAPTGFIINTPRILTFFVQFVAPVLIAFVALTIMSRARGGRVSETVTSSGITIVGIAMLGGAGALMAVGDDIVALIFQ